MPLSKTCFAGRIIIRNDQVGGLNWSDPCPVPSEQRIPTHPPMDFCVPHYDVMIDVLWHLFEDQGLIDHDIVAGPPDEFDRLIDSLLMTHPGDDADQAGGGQDQYQRGPRQPPPDP